MMKENRYSELANRRINKNLFLILVAAVSLLTIFVPVIKKHYIEPAKWKNHFYKGILQKDPDLNKEGVRNYCNCVYDSLISTYKSIDKIPDSKYFTSEDRRAMLNCGIQFLIDDEKRKDFIINNIDDISKGVISLDTIQ